MPVAPVSGHAPGPVRRGHPHSRIATRAIELSAVSVVLFSMLALLGVVWDARDTDWGSWLVPITALVMLVAGIAAGVMAIVSLVKGERRALLLAPLLIGALCAFLVVGEAFIWE